MSDATAFLEGYIADYVIANGVYISLHTGLPTSGNEVTGGSYARRPVVFTKSGSEPTLITNNALVEFAVASAAWGTISHFAVMSALTVGNMLIRKAVVTPKVIAIGDVARFLAGEIDGSIN